MKNIGKKKILALPIFLAIFAGASAVVMLLWNWIVPPVVGWAAIGYWQAAGLLLLCKLLFGGFGRRGHGFCGPHPGFSHKERSEMRRHIHNMSPDERREYIRNHMFGGMPGMSGGCGDARPGGHGGETDGDK